jgi:hypothetical protein
MENETKKQKFELTYQNKKYPVRFRHDRMSLADYYSNDLNNLSEPIRNKVRNVLLMDLSAYGGLTIAYIEVADKVYISAESVCSKLDIYSKEIGRMISFGRLVKKINAIEQKVPNAEKLYQYI